MKFLKSLALCVIFVQSVPLYGITLTDVIVPVVGVGIGYHSKFLGAAQYCLVFGGVYISSRVDCKGLTSNPPTTAKETRRYKTIALKSMLKNGVLICLGHLAGGALSRA